MDYSEVNDSELISMVRESSMEAKDILFNKYKYIIDIEIRKYSNVARVIGYDINDLYQEALVGFSDALVCFREDKEMSLSSFITLCVDRRLQVAIRKANRLKNKLLNESLSLDYSYNDCLPLKDMLSDKNENDPLEKIVKEEKLKELEKAIKRDLSENEYEVYLYMINGLKYDEIATLLNKNLKQVDNTMQRIKGKIRKILEKRNNN